MSQKQQHHEALRWLTTAQEDLAAAKEHFVPLLEKAATLDRYYIPARYPNGLPDLTPGTTFVLADAERACENALLICGEVEHIICNNGSMKE